MRVVHRREPEGDDAVNDPLPTELEAFDRNGIHVGHARLLSLPLIGWRVYINTEKTYHFCVYISTRQRTFCARQEQRRFRKARG